MGDAIARANANLTSLIDLMSKSAPMIGDVKEMKERMAKLDDELIKQKKLIDQLTYNGTAAVNVDSISDPPFAIEDDHMNFVISEDALESLGDVATMDEHPPIKTRLYDDGGISFS
jgi:hypothetical protein